MVFHYPINVLTNIPSVKDAMKSTTKVIYVLNDSFISVNNLKVLFTDFRSLNYNIVSFVIIFFEGILILIFHIVINSRIN